MHSFVGVDFCKTETINIAACVLFVAIKISRINNNITNRNIQILDKKTCNAVDS